MKLLLLQVWLGLTTIALEVRTLPNERQGCGNCVFPFINNARQSDRCTSLDGSEPYCATSVDSSGNLQTSETCTDSTCPGLEGNSPPISVHPLNQLGSCYCGNPNRAESDKRIVGGEKAETGELPWQVALLFGGPELYRQGCGGSLVGDKYVVTAAHCTEGQSPSSLFVRVGDTSLDEEFEAVAFTIGVAAIKQHPQYNSGTLQNDISVLELTEAVSLYEYPNIKPVCLPEAGAVFPGEAVVSGWGTLASRGHQTAYLNEVGVTVFADGNCGSMNSLMSEDMICAGLMAGGKDSCQGDSGGPLVAADPAKNHSLSLVGVVSWGFGCAEPDSLGIYSEVSHFTDWLQGQMPDLNTCPAFTGTAGGNNTSPSTPSSPSTPPTTPTTPGTGPACVEEEIPQKVKFYEKIRSVETWEDCRDACNADTRCDYFKWKDNTKLQKRVCFLMEVVWVPKDNWVSGERNCI